MRLGLVSLLAVALVLPLSSFACGGGSKTSTTPTSSASSSGPQLPPGVDPIDGALAQLAARAAPGMTPESPPAKLSVPPLSHAQLPLGLQAGKCYVVLGIGPAGSDLDLVLAMNGQPIGQDGESDNTATLGTGLLPLCPPQPTQLSLDVTLKNVGGVVGVQLYSKPAPVAATPTTTATTPAVDPTDTMLQTETGKLAKGMQPDGPPSKSTVQEGTKMEVVTTLAPGRCYSIVAVSPTGSVSSLDMDLLMAPFFTMSAGKNSKTGNVALVGGSSNPLCPLALLPIPYRIDVTAKKGSGPVAVQVLSRTK